MPAVTRLGLYGGPRAPYAGFSAAVTIALTGTVTGGLTEADIVAGGKTIILTITSDSWVSAGAAFNAQRQNILNGITAAESEATGWNAEVRDKLTTAAVARTSDTVVTITLEAAADYNVTADETITVTVPASALTSSSEAKVATPTFTVTADAEVAVTGGGGKKKRRRRTGPTPQPRPDPARADLYRRRFGTELEPPTAPVVPFESVEEAARLAAEADARAAQATQALEAATAELEAEASAIDALRTLAYLEAQEAERAQAALRRRALEEQALLLYLMVA